jgi:diguanylate cyclase (GGDEF)-like protein/PAS domain S-box-containing protein
MRDGVGGLDGPDFRRMLESSPDHIIGYDESGCIRYLTPLLQDHLGVSLAEVAGRLPSDVWPDGRFDAFQRAAAQVQRTGVEVSFELRLFDPVSGQHNQKQILVVPERDPAGRVVGTLAFGRNINVQHEAQTRLNHFLGNLPGLAFTLRPLPGGKGGFSFISDGVDAFFGLKPDDLAHDLTPLLQRVHPADRARVQAAMADSARALTPYRLEFSVLCPDAPERWLEVIAAPDTDLDDGVVWHGLMLDISERKRLEREQQAQLHVLACLDRINRVMQEAAEFDPMVCSALDVFLSVFDADRAFLLPPCNPSDPKLVLAMERCVPEAIGPASLSLPMDDGLAAWLRFTREGGVPVQFGPEAAHAVPAVFRARGGVQAMMVLTLSPPAAGVWRFGLSRCNQANGWAVDDVRLLLQMGQRLQDGLARVLMHRDLSASEHKFRSLADSLPDNVVRYDTLGRTVYVNSTLERTLGGADKAMLGAHPREYHPDGSYEDYAQLLDAVLASGRAGELEKTITLPDGRTEVHHIRMLPERDDAGVVRGVIGIGRDITQKKRDEEIFHLAYHDALTGLPNRRLLLDRLKHAMSVSNRSRRHIALMFLDLDHFKALNDRYGHEAGDRLLIEVAHRIAGCVRDADTVARFGGDEFVVLLSDLDTDNEVATSQVARVAEKIRMALARPYSVQGAAGGQPQTCSEHPCSASIGVVVTVNHEHRDDDILKWADIAMYRSKMGGRNQVTFHPMG